MISEVLVRYLGHSTRSGEVILRLLCHTIQRQIDSVWDIIYKCKLGFLIDICKDLSSSFPMFI
jgi:hypothetical protein